MGVVKGGKHDGTRQRESLARNLCSRRRKKTKKIRKMWQRRLFLTK